MRTTNFDAVIASAPLDRAAAEATSGSAANWNPPAGLVGPGTGWQRDRPSFSRPPRGVQGMDGNRFGRLTVLGYSGRRKDCAMWAVRCDCGVFGVRPLRSFSPGQFAGEKREPMCPECRYVDNLKSGEKKEGQEARPRARPEPVSLSAALAARRAAQAPAPVISAEAEEVADAEP